MGDWPLVHLAQVAEVVDCEHKTAPAAEPGTEFGYSVGTPHIRDGRIDYASAKRVTHQTYKEWSRRAELGAGDLILAREAPVGQVGRVDAARPTCLGQRTVLIRADSARVVERYLHAYLLGRDAQQWMADRSAGSTVAHLNVADVREIPVALPSLDEQRRIAGVLGAFDDLIEMNRLTVERLDSAFQLVWRAAFGGRSHDLAPTALGQLCSTQYGYTASASDAQVGPRFLRVADINKRNWIEWESVPFCAVSDSDFERYRLKRDDLVVARMADPGKSAMIDDEERAVFASYLVRLQPNNPELAHFLFGLLKSDYYADYASAVTTGSVQKNMNARVIVGCRVDVPARDALTNFNAFARATRGAMSELLRESAELTRVRDELLPLLMSGRVRVREVA